MSPFQILEYPDEQLREKSAPVQDFDETLFTLVDNLFRVLEEQGGIGLAAPQLGCRQRALVIHVPDDEYGPQVYVNPEIVRTAGLGLVEESCLSVPGIVGNVIRAPQLRVKACDPDGVEFERDLNGMHAVCLQHEIDHLDGKLFIDRLSWFRRMRIRRAAARAERTRLATAFAEPSH